MEIHKNNITKTASADMAMGTVVKLDASDASKVAACSATDTGAIGVVLDNVSSGDNVAVALLGVANHTLEVVAGGAISAGAKVYLAANGKVAATGTIQIGTALKAAYADGNLVEIAHRAPTESSAAA